jgi:hypothetical protein
MITVFGGGKSRSLRVTWLLEEMGLAYRLRPVDLLSGHEAAGTNRRNSGVFHAGTVVGALVTALIMAAALGLHVGS